MVSIERLREVLAYDAQTGLITWKITRHPKYPAGTEAGNITFYGYRQIRVDFKMYFAHRIAWAMHYGRWPEGEIDHIDRDRLNNRISNLRLASKAQNVRNRNVNRNNRCGVKGVSKEGNRWIARICVNRKRIRLGAFSTLEAAAAAYDEASLRLHGEYASPNNGAQS